MAKESEKLYRSIADGEYDPRLKRSLQNIKEVCDEIEKHGGKIYAARVGRLCKEKFGRPAAQSIRNQPDTLKRYVDLRAAEQSLRVDAGQKESKLKISDPKIRAYVLMLEEQVRDYKEENGRLKKLFEGIAPVEIDQLISDSFSNKAPLRLPSVLSEPGKSRVNGSRLSKAARQALEKITCESHLRMFGLDLYNKNIVNATFAEFLNKNEYQALLDLLSE